MSPHPSSDNGAKIAQLRQKLKNELPTFLDTDFNLTRWISAYDGDVDAAVHEMRLNIESRSAAGFDSGQSVADFLHYAPVRLKYAPTFSFSNFKKVVVWEEKNAIIIYQSMEGVDMKNILKMGPISELLLCYFGYLEFFLHQMLELEAKTGRMAQVYVVMDMQGAALRDYMNPCGIVMKYMKYMCHIWQRWHGKQVSKLFILNAPGIVSIGWQIAKNILNEQTRQGVVFLSRPTDLLDHIESTCVPVAFGGKFLDNSGTVDPEKAMNIPRKITSADFYPTDSVWQEMGFKPVQTEEHVKVGQTHAVSRHLEVGQILAWQFWVNGDIEFGIVRIEGAKRTLVHPRFTLATVKVPEEGTLVCEKAGQYHLEFKNHSANRFGVKLEYGVAVSNGE